MKAPPKPDCNRVLPADIVCMKQKVAQMMKVSAKYTSVEMVSHNLKVVVDVVEEGIDIARRSIVVIAIRNCSYMNVNTTIEHTLCWFSLLQRLNSSAVGDL